MDKSRDDVRRGGGASRFSSRQINDNKLVSGSDAGDDLVVPLEKPRKQRLVKKLIAVNRASSSNNNNNNNEDDFEMGCNMSDRETEFPSQSLSSMCNNSSTAKKFKLSKKQLFDDSNGVDHASVPRKLRSAMKKRGCESLSPPLPDSKKLNHTIGLREESPPKKDGLKKSKLSMKQGSSDWSTKHAAGPITKDEEEVVETLYALAGMFPDNDSNDKSELEITPSEAKCPALPDCKESPTPTNAIEDSAVTKEEASSSHPLRTSENTTPSPHVENSVEETARVDSLNEPTVQEQPGLNDSRNLRVNSESCVPQGNLHNMLSSLSKLECNNDKPSCDPIKFHLLPEPNQDSRLEPPSQKDTSLLDRKSEVILGVTAFGGQLVQQDVVMESKNKGLWTGLSPMVLHDAGIHGPSSQSSAAKVPAWLDAALCASKPCSLENGFSTGKVFKGASTRRSLKRCAAHVSISRLIQDLKMPERKDKSPLQPDPLRIAHEGQKQGIILPSNELDRVKKGFNGVISCNSSSSTFGKNLSEVRNGIVQHNRLHEDQQQNATASRANTFQKQSFDFLSLSAGGGEAEATKSFNRTGNHGIAPSSQFQVPYLHSLPQHQRFMTHPMPQTRYPSSAYPDQHSTSTSASSQQVQLQLPSYLSSPYLGPTHTSPTFTTKQQQQQKHQHHQQIWAAQLATQYRPVGTSTAINQFPSWVNGRHDPTLLHCPQSIITTPPSSLEVLGPKYSPVSQHQQHHQQQQQQPHLVTLTSSFPPTRVKRQDHHLPLVYEEIEGGFRTSGAFPLQLLCNERL